MEVEKNNQSKEVVYPDSYKILSTTDLNSYITYLNEDFFECMRLSSRRAAWQAT